MRRGREVGLAHAALEQSGGRAHRLSLFHICKTRTDGQCSAIGQDQRGAEPRQVVLGEEIEEFPDVDPAAKQFAGSIVEREIPADLDCAPVQPTSHHDGILQGIGRPV